MKLQSLGRQFVESWTIALVFACRRPTASRGTQKIQSFDEEGHGEPGWPTCLRTELAEVVKIQAWHKGIRDGKGLCKRAPLQRWNLLVLPSLLEAFADGAMPRSLETPFQVRGRWV